MSARPELTPERAAFYEKIDRHHLTPLWAVLSDLVTATPASRCRPARWRFDEIRGALLEAGGLITAQEAERRVLVLENPALRGTSRTTATIYAGIQLITPGEAAPAHRHTPSALRFMMEGEGAVTAVGGERTQMRRGDFVITPSWAWHDHGNEGTEPCAWLDVLDLPLVRFLEAGFNEHYNDAQQSITRPEGDSNARYGEGLVPLNARSRYGPTTPIFNYPYSKTRPALLAAASGEAPNPHEAIAFRYANPLDGGWAMPTISAWMVHLPAGFETRPMRSTDAQVMCLSEGRLSARFGDGEFQMEENDVAACPGWTWRQLRAERDSFLFCASDRTVHEKLGLYREERS